MKGNARKFRMKERKLLKLYSLWHETHHEGIQRQCLTLLGEILAIRPRFKLRNEFRQAF